MSNIPPNSSGSSKPSSPGKIAENAKIPPAPNAATGSVAQAPGQSHTPSLARRYSFKLISNAAAIPLYLVMEAILPRSLGPAAYGVFSYATGMFQYLLNFLDFGTSTCLFTALSKRQRDWPLLAFFWRIAVLLFVLTLLFAGLCMLPQIGSQVMPGVPAWVMPLAGLWAFGFWGMRVLRGVNDALGQTVASEKIRTLAGVLACLALLVLHFFNVLTLPVLFVHQLVYLFAMIAAFKVIVLRNWGGWRGWTPWPPEPEASQNEASQPEASQPEARQNETSCDEINKDEAGKQYENVPAGNIKKIKFMLALSPEEHEAYRKEFASYSFPLFLQLVTVALALMADRWLLQVFNGNVEQGFFSISQKVGFACFMFVSAMIPLLTRELAVAHGKNDYAEMGRLLSRFAPMLYAVATYFSAFVCLEAATVVDIFGGQAFAPAVLAVQIMALYPIHQGYGQMTQAVFYASAKTRALSKVTAVSCLLGFGVSLYLILPPHYGGLGLAAEGLAGKTVLMQVLMCNFMLFMCSRFIPLCLGRLFAHQIICLALFLGLAWVATQAAQLSPWLFGLEAFGWQGLWGQLAGFASRGLLYSLLCLGLVLVFPWAVGVTRLDLKKALAFGLGKLAGKNKR